jgi:hypothetical protein
MTKLALYCPSQRTWEYNQASLVLLLCEISLSHYKRGSMSGTHKNKIKNEQFPGESTYLADKEIRLLMELEGAAEGVLDLSANVVLLA